MPSSGSNSTIASFSSRRQHAILKSATRGRRITGCVYITPTTIANSNASSSRLTLTTQRLPLLPLVLSVDAVAAATEKQIHIFVASFVPAARVVLVILVFANFVISAKWTEWMAKILFSFDVYLSVCVCACARSGPVNQTRLKRLKLRTSNLTCIFLGTVAVLPWLLKNFSKRGRL